jgi:hypothetical protein
MSRNGSGTAVKAISDFIADTIISESDMNTLINDIIDMLTQSISKDGQTIVTGNLQMGDKKLIGLGVGTASNDSLTFGQAQAEAMIWADTASGTADALLLTPTPAITAYAAGQRFVFISSASPNTEATTVNVNGVETKAIENAGSALTAGNIAADKMYQIIYDGTAFQISKVALADTVTTIADGDVDADDNTMSKLDLKNYSELINDIGSIGGGTQDIDLTLGNVIKATVDTSATTFTFSNLPPATSASSFTVVLKDGGSQDVDWPASVHWPGGIKPPLTSSGTDILVFMTVDDGNPWHGAISSVDSS